MIVNPGQIIIFGLPLYFYLGIVTFIALISTAVLGMLFVKGKYGVQFSWHMNLARITIVIAIIHGALVAWALHILTTDDHLFTFSRIHFQEAISVTG